MSRIGKKPISIPEGVKVKCDKGTVIIEGPKGTIDQPIHSLMKIEIDDVERKFVVIRPSEERQCKELHGLTRTLLANNVHGVTNGFSKDLEIIGLGYNVKMQAEDLILQLGFSHPIKLKIPKGIKVDIHN